MSDDTESERNKIPDAQTAPLPAVDTAMISSGATTGRLAAVRVAVARVPATKKSGRYRLPEFPSDNRVARELQIDAEKEAALRKALPDELKIKLTGKWLDRFCAVVSQIEEPDRAVIINEAKTLLKEPDRGIIILGTLIATLEDLVNSKLKFDNDYLQKNPGLIAAIIKRIKEKILI